MFVSRKNLALIHFVPGIRTGGAHVFEPSHEGVHARARPFLRRVLLQPLAESRVQRLMPRARHQAGLFNESFFRTQSNILHANLVYTIFVYLASIQTYKQRWAERVS